LDNIIMLPAQSLGASVNSMAGQNISIGQWRRVSRITKYGLLYNLMIMSIIGVIIFIFAKYLNMMFVQDAESVIFSTYYLRIIAFFFLFLGIIFVLNGIVRSSGSMYLVLFRNNISFLVLRYPLASFFA